MTKSEMAFELHKKGFNCAQSVALPFAEELGLDPTILSKSLEGFGAGMGGYELACGALSATIYIAGIKFSDGNLNMPSSKRNTYAVCKELCKDFKVECGSVVCAELKGLTGGEMLKNCNDCIITGVKLIEKMLREK